MFLLGASDGYVWIGGYSGVFKYDGSIFEKYDTSSGFTSARAFFEDSEGRIWVGTNDDGIVVVDGEETIHITEAEGLPSSSIRIFEEDNDGNVFVGTTSGVCYIDKNMVVHSVDNERINKSRVLKLDKDAAGRTSGNGFYYLIGDAARLHSAMLSYARDFMIDKGFTYCIPPFMIRSNVVTGVMSFKEMEAMMYKIEGEDLYLIGTSEHSMIGRFQGQLIDEASLPQCLTSYSPCFRKEVGSHGIEERGVYRVHQFEKQEMVVLCKPEESMDWYNKMWRYTVDFFRALDVPVRTLECCSGDLADLKVKSCDVEAWSPRQQKYFEVGSCSTLGDAQARRLGIRTKGENGTYLVHTLNNTVLATPRGLIAVLENNVNEDGSIRIPKALQPYMGGKTVIEPKNK